MAWAAILLMTMVAAVPVRAQIEPEPVAAVEGPMFTSEDLDSLVAPIALYPDSLLSLVLAAATEPLQIVHAYRYLQSRKTDASLKPSPNWHTAIIGLLNYPAILKMMNDDLEWTEQLGLAFIHQEGDLMDAVQHFRARVYAAGHLRSDENTLVVREREIIKIAPVRTEVIYVPVYDPYLVILPRYVRRPPLIIYHPYPAYYSPGAAFFSGLFIGFAIHYGFDWHLHRYHVHGWHEYWGYRHIDIHIQRDIDIGRIKIRRHRIVVNRDRRDIRRDRRKAAALSDHRRVREGRPTRRQEGLEGPERVRPPRPGAGPAPVQRTKRRTAREADILKRVAPRKPRPPVTEPRRVAPRQPGVPAPEQPRATPRKPRPPAAERRRVAPQPLHDYRRGTETIRQRQRGVTSRERARPPRQRPSYQRQRPPTVARPPTQRLRPPPVARPPTRREQPPPSARPPARRIQPPPSAKPPSRRDRPRSSPGRRSGTRAFPGFRDGAKAGQMSTRGSESRGRSARTRRQTNGRSSDNEKPRRRSLEGQ
jgi:hypothetical protein